jgi:hypothetical protein
MSQKSWKIKVAENIVPKVGGLDIKVFFLKLKSRAGKVAVSRKVAELG